ncbi:MAG: dienelactone hydrolase family protein [Acidobacteriaceae bacterium]
MLVFASCGGWASQAARPTTAMVSPAARSVTQQSFTFAKVTYRYLVFTPSGFSSAKQLPVLLLIHGAGGRGRDMLDLWQSFAEKKGIILVAPTFPLDARFETLVPKLYPQLMDSVKQSWHFDAHRVYIFGFSAGGYSTFDAATLDSTYFAAAGVFAAIITPGYYSIVTQAQRKTPIAIYIGDHDQFFTLAQTRATSDILRAHGFTVHYMELTNQDHHYGAISTQVNSDAWRFMCQYSLP